MNGDQEQIKNGNNSKMKMMKKILLITLILIANFVNAQTQLSDYYDASTTNRPEFSYNITVRIQKTTGATAYDTRYTATLIQALPDSKGFYNANKDGKFYTCSVLGNVCNPNDIHLISVRLSYTCNGQQKADVVVFRNLNDVQQINVVAGAGGKFCESIDFNMNVMGATLDPTHLRQIIDKINQTITTKTSQNNSTNKNPVIQANTNQSENSESKNIETNTTTEQIPESYKGNPMTYNTNTGSTALDSFTTGYQQGQQIADVAVGLIDLFTPSPEEQARKAKEKLLAAQRAEEYRQAQLKLQYENEQNAKNEFSILLTKYAPLSTENKNYLVINLMDNYISEKYNFDVSAMIPDWINWIKEAIASNDKFATVVFAGKALGFNYKKFQYNIGLTKEDALKLLEKVANSDTEFKPFVGISYEINKKIISEKNKKKKVISKEVNTFKTTFVKEGSAAEIVGIKKDDVILKINNEYQQDFAETIQKFKIGTKVSITILREGKELIKDLTLGSAIKDNYKVDAILLLAHNYNLKTGGNDPEKALYYFTKAAENGSPNAMFALGEIYQKNVFGTKKINVKFKFKKNEEFALDWYLKSIQDTNYKASSIYWTYKVGSSFEPQSFDELINSYKKGIGCKKSPEKAEEILVLKNEYLINHP